MRSDLVVNSTGLSCFSFKEQIKDFGAVYTRLHIGLYVQSLPYGV